MDLAGDSSGAANVATIAVSLANTEFTDTVTVSIDTFASLAIEADAHPSCSLAGCSARTALRRIHETDVFQRVDLALLITSALGTAYSKNPDGNFAMTVSNSGVLLLLQSGTRLTGVADGTADACVARGGS